MRRCLGEFETSNALVEAQGILGVTGLDELLELRDLFGTPKHGCEFETKSISTTGFPRTPSVDPEIKRNYEMMAT